MFQQQLAQRGFAGLGETRIGDSRPSIDYVKAGDVIRVNLVWFRPTGLFADVPALYAKFRSALSSVFGVIAMSPQEYWLSAGGDIIIDVQPRSDYSRLADVVSIVANRAQTSGMNVDVARTRGEFISKVETTGGDVAPTLPDPRTVPSADNSGDGIASFFSGLTQSPVTLAVILGAAVVLVIAAKK